MIVYKLFESHSKRSFDHNIRFDSKNYKIIVRKTKITIFIFATARNEPSVYKTYTVYVSFVIPFPTLFISDVGNTVLIPRVGEGLIVPCGKV